MPLERLALSLDQDVSLPGAVQALIEDAAARADHFIDMNKDDPAAGFVPSDYAMVYRALRTLHDDRAGLLPGNSFCEWGSGIGAIACMAAMIGFDSIGIEIDARLVEAARELARDHDVNVQFVHGSYVPDGHRCEEDFDESHVMTLESGRAAYEELGLDPDDFDCIFAYPWPGEDDVVTAVFDCYAARGATLLTYHGQDGLMLRRKQLRA